MGADPRRFAPLEKLDNLLVHLARLCELLRDQQDGSEIGTGRAMPERRTHAANVQVGRVLGRAGRSHRLVLGVLYHDLQHPGQAEQRASAIRARAWARAELELGPACDPLGHTGLPDERPGCTHVD